MYNPNNPLSLYHYIEEIFKNNEDIITFSQFFKINEYNEKQLTSESLWSEESIGHMVDNISVSSFVKEMRKLWELENQSTELPEHIHTKYKNLFTPEYENTKYQLAFLTWDEEKNWIILDYFELPDFKNLSTSINEVKLPKNNVLNIYTNLYAKLHTDQFTNIEDLRYGKSKTILNNDTYNIHFIESLIYAMRQPYTNIQLKDIYDSTSKWNRFIKKYFSNELQDKAQIIISDESLQSELKDANIPAISLPLNYFM